MAVEKADPAPAIEPDPFAFLSDPSNPRVVVSGPEDVERSVEIARTARIAVLVDGRPAWAWREEHLERLLFDPQYRRRL